MVYTTNRKINGLIFVGVTSIIVALAQVLLALSMKKGLELILNFESIQELYKLIAMFIGSILFNGAGYYLKGLASAKYKKNSILFLKTEFMNSIMNLRIKDYLKIGSGDIVSQFTADVNRLESQYYDMITNIIQDVISFLISSIVIFSFSPYIGIAIYFLTAILVFLPLKAHQQLQRLGYEFSNKTSEIATKVNELFRGYEIIKSYGATTKVIDEFNKINQECEESRYLIGVKEAWVVSVLVATSLLSFCGPFVIGLLFVVNGKITPGALMAITNLASSVISPVQKLGGNVANYKIGKGTWDKIISTISKTRMLSDTTAIEAQKIQIDSLQHSIKLKEISFSYETREILHSISFEFIKGKKYLIMGESGSGKSTLLKVIMNYFDDYAGDVFFDEHELRQINSDCIAGMVSFISQDPFVFNGSLCENIIFNKEFVEEQFISVCKQAAVDRFIDRMEAGIKTQLGDGSCRLSGGEKQRMAIARALYADTEVLLVDEATSALDDENSRMVNEILLGLNKTVIYVSHKMEHDLLSKFDAIIRIDNGSITSTEYNNKSDLSA